MTTPQPTPAQLVDPARTRAVTALRLDLEDDLEAVTDHVDQFMQGDTVTHADGRPLALIDALDTLERCRQAVTALIALGPPQRQHPVE